MCVLYSIVPTCRLRNSFFVQVTVMCLFLRGCRGVKSLHTADGHCVKSGPERKYQHLGRSLSLSHTHKHTHRLHSESFEEKPVQALQRKVSHLYDLWRLQSEVLLVRCVCVHVCERELLQDKHRRGDKASGRKRNHLLSSLPNFNPTLSSWPCVMNDVQEGALDMDRRARYCVHMHTHTLTLKQRDSQVLLKGKIRIFRSRVRKQTFLSGNELHNDTQ